MELTEIGKINQQDGLFSIQLHEKYKKGLTNIEGFSLLNILWWADQTEDEAYGSDYVIRKPYVKGPESIGVFATRSQIRPNPVCITPVSVFKIDQAAGIIYTYYIDAFPGSSVIDIKPYLPSTDIAKNVSVPEWCSHWPDSIDSSADFDWEAEFNFPV
ncbi:MAG: SAM-dependent methyltransferase [Spirochaetes bacterium]|nr:SAM-dependent methyltransferase [Spirochaetota bacterium]